MSNTGDRHNWPKWVALALIGVWVGGCAMPTPKQIKSVDSSEDTVKFLYRYQHDDGEWERGVYECDIEGDELNNCRRLEVEYW